MGDSIEYCDKCENNVGCHLNRGCLATEVLLPVDQRRLVLAFSAPHWPKPCTTLDLATIAKMAKRETANKLRALAKRGIVRQWHTDPSGQQRYGCVCWSLCQNVQAVAPATLDSALPR